MASSFIQQTGFQQQNTYRREPMLLPDRRTIPGEETDSVYKRLMPPVSPAQPAVPPEMNLSDSENSDTEEQDSSQHQVIEWFTSQEDWMKLVLGITAGIAIKKLLQ